VERCARSGVVVLRGCDLPERGDGGKSNEKCSAAQSIHKNPLTAV
jgi:hypothetical protein